jgi:hypothetical protein
MDCRLAVDRQHLLEGLKLVRRLVRRRHSAGRAVLGFNGRWVTIEVGPVTFFAHAVGTWPGNAVVSAALVQALAAVPPPVDPVVLTCDGEHLRFGALKVACQWQSVSSVALERPPQAEWLEGIALKYTMPRARIIAEGRGSEVKMAERKLIALVRRVAKALAPMGVTVDDVTLLVERRLEERYGVGANPARPATPRLI